MKNQQSIYGEASKYPMIGGISGASLSVSLTVFLLTFLLVFGSSTSFALDRDRPLRNLYHASWTMRDGAPGDIFSLAQAEDGALWMVGHLGLFRFDGLSFERYQPPAGQLLLSNNISGVMAGAGGEIWISYEFGGASLLKNGKLTNYGEAEGLPVAAVFDAQRDLDGNIWLATSRQLMRFDGSHWQKIQSNWNFPYGYTRSIHMDKRGTLWIATHDALMFLRRGSHRFEPTNITVNGFVTMTDGPDGTLWLGTGGTIRQFVTTSAAPIQRGPVIRADAIAIRFDHQGSLWIATTNEGILRVVSPENLNGMIESRSSQLFEHYTEQDGLTSDHLSHLLVDRQDNVWVASSHGLDRFRNANAAEFETPQGEDLLASAADQRGDLFVAGKNTYLIHDNKISKFANPHAPKGIWCVYRDPGRTMWFGGSGSLWKYTNGRYSSIAVPHSVTSQNNVQAMTMDDRGSLWVSFLRKGVFELTGNSWKSPEDLPQLPPEAAITEATDSAHRVWFGYPGDKVVLLQGDKVRIFGTADGVTVGNVSAITEVDGHVWIGGDYGLENFFDNRFQSLRTMDSNLLESVSGIAGTSNGDLWAGQASGIVHLKASEIKQSIDDSTHRAQGELFNYLDGIQGSPSSVNPLPSLTKGRDDRLWFITQSGLFWIDSEHIYRDTVPPPVVVQGLIADGVSHHNSSNLTLAPNIENLEIDYTAFDLAMPERVHFRYKLDGVNEGWLDADVRRQAFYTRLKPGRYKFQVIAANGSGVLNEVGDTIEFTILPTFYQTTWFKILCGIACLGLFCLVFQIGLREKTKQIRARLGERLEERERIARELHDTLLQGFQAVVIHFQVAMKRMPDHEPTRESMEAALNHADEVIAEGRDRVQNLRGEGTVVEDLASSLAAYGRQHAQQNHIDFKVTTVGLALELDLIVRDEIYRIGREALNNSFKHARASKIEVEVIFESALFRMTIRDNGVGIDEIFLNSGRPGHWGLAGMRERAQKIGGQLSVWSRQGAGTEFEVQLPSGIAYKDKSRDSRWTWSKRVRNKE